MSKPDPDSPGARRAAANAIIANPSGYFVCEGCDNIFRTGGATDKSGICRQCHAFRFDRSREGVIAAAQRLASRPRSTPTPDDYL